MPRCGRRLHLVQYARCAYQRVEDSGIDVLYGQAGADSIDALDGFPYRDRLVCGSEIDSTSSDSRDVRDPDCETILGF